MTRALRPIWAAQTKAGELGNELSAHYKVQQADRCQIMGDVVDLARSLDFILSTWKVLIGKKQTLFYILERTLWMPYGG